MERLPFRPSFAAALRREQQSGRVPVIPDLKVRSPKEGELLRGRDPVRFARELAAAGAPAISVVTESERFGGSLEMLAAVAAGVDVPVLRKDFIRDPAELERSQAAGAAAVLLIAAHLAAEELAALHEEAHRRGLQTLIEVHTPEELAKVRGLELDALGINNRDILQLERDDGTVSTTERLAPLVPPGTLLVSESGIATPEDVHRAIAAGATAVLVGTAILKAADPVACLRALQMPGLYVSQA